jgi:hypothetical protein
MEIARLSESERGSISDGRSAKKILNRKAFEKRQQRSAERLEYERTTGLLSDQVADVILAFCAGGEKHPQTPMLAVDFPKFLPRVSAYVATLDLWNTPRVRVSKKAGLVGLFKRLRPRETKDVLWVEHHAEWLALVMRNIAPERSILMAGLEKAENRPSELERRKDKKTPEQLYWERAERLNLLSFGPPVHRPKKFGKLARQGRKSRT